MRHWRHPRIDGYSDRVENRRADRARPRRREIKTVLGDISARRWSNLGSALDARSRYRADEDRLPPALARLVPVFMPDLLFRLTPTGSRCSRNLPRRSCRPNSCRASSSAPASMQPIDYCVAHGGRRIEPPSNLDLATIQQQELAMTFRFHISQYLSRRAADWKAKGFTETLADWRDLERALEILGRRSARRVQELGGGHRSAQPARSVVRASTNASCCANCCAAST